MPRIAVTTELPVGRSIEAARAEAFGIACQQVGLSCVGEEITPKIKEITNPLYIEAVKNAKTTEDVAALQAIPQFVPSENDQTVDRLMVSIWDFIKQ